MGARLPGWIRTAVRLRVWRLRFVGYGARYLWFRIRNPHVVTHGMVFLGRGAEVSCRRGLGHLEIGRWVWIGEGTRVRCHEGFLRIGHEVVFGAGDVVNCYLEVDIGPETIMADWVYVADFDHRFDRPGPVRTQGIVKTPVRIGAGSWLGVRATVLRGTTLGPGTVVGAHAVARGRYPDGAVIAGVPARVVRRRRG